MFHIAFLAKFVFFLRLISHFLSQFLHLPISFVCIVTLIVIRDRSCQRQTCDYEDDNNDDDDGDDDDDIGYWAMTMIMTMILSLIMIRDRSCHRQTLQTKSLISEANYFCDKSSATKFQLHIRAELS